MAVLIRKSLKLFLMRFETFFTLIYLAVTEEKVGVVNTERIVTTEIDFKVAKMIEQLQNGNFGGNQLHFTGEKTAAVFPVES